VRIETQTFVDRVLARAAADPGAELVRDEQGALTAGEFAALVGRMARALEARGLQRGDRVAILATNSCAAIALRYAAWTLGCTAVFCPDRTPEAFASFLNVVDPALLVVFPQTAARARDVRVEVTAIGELDAGPPNDPPVSQARPGDLAALVPSGGTTGAQKASRLTFAIYERTIAAPPLPARRQLVCMPLAHVSQIHADLTLLGGGTLVLHEGFEPAAVLATIEAQRITHTGLVEPQLVELADHPDLQRRDVSSLRAVTHIGANAPASLRRRLLERIGPVLVHPYGASELGMVSMLAPPEYDLSRPGLLSSAGRPLPGIEVRIDGSEGADGVIAVRTPTMADGYAGGIPAPGFADGWYTTGDLGRLDAEGYLHVRGRAADARRIDGETVLPLDVEDALCAHPAVRYAVALPDPAGDGFVAFVTLAPDADADAAALQRHVAASVRTVIALDRMPTTQQGKPDRGALYALVSAA
jgi:acyl-CoA synthetase (AMP-forming)/AMP-acid ligase II